MVSEPNESVNCDATVAASCLAFFPAVGTPGIVATRQRDAICATPPEPTEAFSRANLWKTEVGLVKRLEGFEAINGAVVRRGGMSTSSQQQQQQQQRKKATVTNKKSKLGEKIGRAHVELQSHSDLVCRLLLEKKKNTHKKKKHKKKKKEKQKKEKKKEKREPDEYLA